MPAYTSTLNWQPPISSHPGDAGLCDPKRVGRPKKNSKNDNLSPLNLGNAFAHDNVGGDDVLITGIHDTGIYFTYENVDPNKVTRQEYNDFTDFILNSYQVYLDCYMLGYLVPEFFWGQLVPHLCMPRSHSVVNPNNEGWLSEDQMSSWIEILIRSRLHDADWTEESGIVWKLTLFFPDLRIMVPLSNLIKALAVVKNGVPKMKGLFSFSLMGSVGREFLEKPEHFSHPVIDFPALLEDGVLKSLHSFSVRSYADGAVNLTFNMEGDMIIKKLDFEPEINAMMRDVLDPSRQKELSKELGSKILPRGDGSC
nr:hypothetical protein [Tanacetum cinerariifolium]